MANIPWGFGFERQEPNPLDPSEVFDTLADFDHYLTTGLAYAGQVVGVKDGGNVPKVYVVNNDGHSHTEVGFGGGDGGGARSVFSVVDTPEVDLNKVIEAGFYEAYQYSTGSIQNTPPYFAFTGAGKGATSYYTPFVLLVEGGVDPNTVISSGDAKMVKQTITALYQAPTGRIAAGQVYQRTCYHGAWTDWVNVSAIIFKVVLEHVNYDQDTQEYHNFSNDFTATVTGFNQYAEGTVLRAKLPQDVQSTGVVWQPFRVNVNGTGFKTVYDRAGASLRGKIAKNNWIDLTYRYDPNTNAYSWQVQGRSGPLDGPPSVDTDHLAYFFSPPHPETGQPAALPDEQTLLSATPFKWQDVAAVMGAYYESTYTCTGENDDVVIADRVNGFFQNTDGNAPQTMLLLIKGRIGLATTPANRTYIAIDGGADSKNRTVILDFSQCTVIGAGGANTFIHIKGDGHNFVEIRHLTGMNTIIRNETINLATRLINCNLRGSLAYDEDSNIRALVTNRYSGAHPSGALYISNCSIDSTSAGQNSVQLVKNEPYCRTVLNHCRLRHSGYGGDGIHNMATIVISNCHFVGGPAFMTGNYVISNNGGARLVVNSCVFDYAAPMRFGGPGEVFINNCVLIHPSCNIIVGDNFSGSVSVTNSIIESTQSPGCIVVQGEARAMMRVIGNYLASFGGGGGPGINQQAPNPYVRWFIAGNLFSGVGIQVGVEGQQPTMTTYCEVNGSYMRKRWVLSSADVVDTAYHEIEAMGISAQDIAFYRIRNTSTGGMSIGTGWGETQVTFNDPWGNSNVTSAPSSANFYLNSQSYEDFYVGQPSSTSVWSTTYSRDGDWVFAFDPSPWFCVYPANRITTSSSSLTWTYTFTKPTGVQNWSSGLIFELWLKGSPDSLYFPKGANLFNVHQPIPAN